MERDHDVLVVRAASRISGPHKHPYTIVVGEVVRRDLAAVAECMPGYTEEQVIWLGIRMLARDMGCPPPQGEEMTSRDL